MPAIISRAAGGNKNFPAVSLRDGNTVGIASLRSDASTVRPAAQLRPARTEDSAACRALVNGVLAEFGLQPDPAATDADLADVVAHYAARGGDFAVLVDETGTIVGTCGLFPVEPGVVELRKMYLVPAWRGRGQGSRLLDWALTRARALGFRRMTLETATVLQDAIALYERHGFQRERGGVHSCRCDLSYSRAL